MANTWFCRGQGQAGFGGWVTGVDAVSNMAACVFPPVYRTAPDVRVG